MFKDIYVSFKWLENFFIKGQKINILGVRGKLGAYGTEFQEALYSVCCRKWVSTCLILVWPCSESFSIAMSNVSDN